jgi:hypothetical protein
VGCRVTAAALDRKVLLATLLQASSWHGRTRPPKCPGNATRSTQRATASAWRLSAPRIHSQISSALSAPSAARSLSRISVREAYWG